MELRRILLRILLLALALAALAGVVGVITAAGDTIWRIVATAVATAIAVAVMLPFSQMMDKHRWRAGGTGGMAWTVIEYLLIVALIWLDYAVTSARGPGLTLLAWTICGLPAVFLLGLAEISEARLASRVGIILAAAMFGMLMIWAWGRDLPWLEREKWWDVAMALGALGALVVANLVHAGTGDGRWWRWLGILAAIGAWLVAEAGIIMDTDSLLGRQVLTGLASGAAVLGLANLALLVPLAGMQVWVRRGMLLAAGLCAGAINALVHYDGAVWQTDAWGRVAAGSGIVAGCGSLALLILARINRRVEYRPKEGALPATDMAIVCPHCGKSQKIKLGGAACRACGLRIQINIEEPRCPECGYLM